MEAMLTRNTWCWKFLPRTGRLQRRSAATSLPNQENHRRDASSGLVQEQSVYASAKKRAQVSLGRVVGIQKLFFDQPCKKILCEILGFVSIQAPAQANILVDRLPIGRNEGIRGPGALRRVAAVCGCDHRA